jgi:dihydroxy-acid dehydratase
MNWTEEDLGKPQVLIDSAYGMGHPGTFHFRELIEEVSNGVYEAGASRGSSPSVTSATASSRPRRG